MRKYLFVLLLMSGCSYSDPLQIPGLNYADFKHDRGGCNGFRKSQIELLKTQKDRFLGISENQIMEAIGRYDYQVLDRKNEKIYVYFLESGPQCENIQNPTKAESLVIYMNAVKLVKEIQFLKGGHTGL